MLKKKQILLRRGFTLIELFLAASILVLVLAGIMALYINLFFLLDLSRDLTLAINAIESKMEEIHRMNFDDIVNASFNLTDYGFSYSESKGKIDVENTTYSDLKKVTIRACFKSKGRLIGDSIENCASSVVEAVTLITK